MAESGAPVTWRPDHGWLAAALPADARTFRSSDPALAATLAASGATPVADAPDVEVERDMSALRGDAAAAIVLCEREALEGAPAARRIPSRLAGAATVAARAALARRALSRLGLRDVVAMPWDHARQPVLDSHARPRARARELARAPLGAVVTGRRTAGSPTIAGAAVAEAGAAELASVPPRVGLSGVVLVLGEHAVLRVVLDAGAGQIDRGVAVLEDLRAAATDDLVRDRIAWPTASGALPLARWVLEPRLPGAPATSIDGAVLDDAAAFLAALFATPLTAGEPGATPEAAAAVVAAACPPDAAEQARSLGAWLGSELAQLPRGTGHGDFWADNLLVEGGRLRGVVDWTGAGPGRLPATDLLHLLTSAEVRRSGTTLGAVVTGWLLPAAREGRLPAVGAYLGALGLEADPALVRRLAVAYWLDHVAMHLGEFADRSERPGWLGPNVVEPLRHPALQPV